MKSHCWQRDRHAAEQMTASGLVQRFQEQLDKRQSAVESWVMFQSVQQEGDKFMEISDSTKQCNNRKHRFYWWEERWSKNTVEWGNVAGES